MRLPRQTLVLDCPADISVTPLVLRARIQDCYRLHAVYVGLSASVGTDNEIRLRVKNGAGDTLAVFPCYGNVAQTSVTFAPVGYDSLVLSPRGEIPQDLILTPEMSLELESSNVGFVFSGKCVITFEPLEE